MESKGVFVQIEHSEYGFVRGSGLKINNEIVIVHGSLLASLCSSHNEKTVLISRYKSTIKQLRRQSLNQGKGLTCIYNNSSIVFKVMTNTREPEGMIQPCTYNHQVSPNKILLSGDCTVTEAKLIFLYKNTELLTGKHEMSDSMFSDSEEDKYDLIARDSLSLFIFLSLKEISQPSVERTLLETYHSVKNTLLYPGLELVVESTPFGNHWFSNSWSRGVISKLIGAERDGLLLTDARLVYGCEGAPIYLFNDGVKGALIGMVIQTTSFCNGEWIGFSLGITMRKLLGAVLELHSTQDYLPFAKLQMELPPTGVNLDLTSAIVFVRCQYKWGSGVVIDSEKGIILTCSHIIDHDHSAVNVICAEGRVPATVVYATPLSGPYDLAVLSVGPRPGLAELPMADTPPIIGERVFACGYPLSREALVMEDRCPTLSAGCVSHVSRHGGPLQSTCCTHSGLSGGAIIRPPHHLVGVVVCNAKLNNARSPMSSFSFAVSVEDFREPITQFLKNNDPSSLKPLCIKKPEVIKEWLLLDCKI